uniref:TSA: Wollemia nobilis Ref_Wollemi_Transcript_7180_1598 transcribed RNA sequence n=1 Tax=Wollemia nobilis TaxID=56998 RepID=A0A0C9QV86_9CONI
MTSNGKIIPHLSQQATNDSNLTVLQRIDRHVEEILTTAAHVTLYDFNVELTQWSRKDVEGSLFVVKRRTQPRFQFIVMNRRSTENLVEDLLSDFEYEIQLPYLLYRNGNQEVIGIWFYNPRECEEVAKLFSRILNAFSKVPPKPKVFTNQSNEFQELESVPTSATIEGPLEPTSSTVADASEEHLERFFSAALHLNNRQELSSSTSMRPITMAHSLSSSSPSVASPTLAPLPVPSPPLPASSVSLSTIVGRPLDISEGSSSHTTLVKPSFFVPPPLSSTPMPLPLSSAPMAPPLNPLVSLQPSLGAPLLQPFPPPAPSQSLASASTLSQGPVITRDGVRDALLRLAKNEHFIDMLYREMLNAHT